MRGLNWQARGGVAGLALGLAVALLSLMPYFSLLEEKIGLGLLFNLRGEIPSPPEVVIVNISRQSAYLLSLPDRPEQWPRRLHAQLIRRLHAAGAELIGFDVFFGAGQAEDDAEMASAMRESGSVVLANYLKLKHLLGDAYVESLEEPPSQLADAALANVPFLLPQGEETDRFLLRYGENGDQPTFPLALFHLFLLKQLGGDGQYPKVAQAQTNTPADYKGAERLLDLKPELRDRIINNLRTRPGEGATRVSLAETFAGERSRYFNHYGPAGAIPRIPYHQLVLPQEGSALPNLRGKLLLVGFDEDFQPESAYFSPFSAVSSLELAATAVANLLQHNDIHPLLGRWSQFAWLAFWGFLLGCLSSKRLLVGLTGILALSFGYLAAAYWLFSAYWLWLPVILPLVWLSPLGFLGCLLDNYLARTREHKKIQSVVNRFIPEQAANRTDNPEDDPLWESKLYFGVALATDAGQYTALAEKMRPMELGELMNDYYSALFPPVRMNGGWVSDVTGDAMMAIWNVPKPDTDIRLGALKAALAIRQAVDDFESNRRIRLPIRMGLHCGEMRIGFVGGKGHGAWRAVGDTVNTSARLEGLNKVLGTRILVSRALVDGVDDFATRPVGRFMLAGKAHAVDVHELIGLAGGAPPAAMAMMARFAGALALFEAADWTGAAMAFEALAREFPEDGPSRFYAQTARAHADNPLAAKEFSAIAVDKPAPGRLADEPMDELEP